MIVQIRSRGDERHPGDEQIERYARGLLSEMAVAQFEEHLLICEDCRQRLDETEGFLIGMTAAGRELHRQRERRPHFRLSPRIAWGLAAALIVIAVAMSFRTMPGFSSVPAVHIALQATRGSDLLAQAPRSAPLVLRLDLNALPRFDRYPLELANESGARVWEGSTTSATAEATVPGQRPGIYFMRVYSPDRQLLREYGLRVR